MTIWLKLSVNRKTIAATFILALLFSIAAVLQSISLVSANPVPYPPAPNTDLPTLTVQTPPNYSDCYAANTVILSFAVTKPDSWNSYWLGVTSGLPVVGDYSVWVYLDGNLNCTYWDPCVRDVLTTNYSLVLDGLTSEPHTLRIDLLVRAFYNNSNYSNEQTGQYSEYRSNVTQTIHFTLNVDSKTLFFTEEPQVISREPYPSQSPSSSPSLSSSPSPSLQEAELESESFPTTWVATSILSVAVVSLSLLVYFKKRNGKG